jgi:hypothetical protein
MAGVKIARTEFGVEIMRTFDGSRWLWNEAQSWLEFIPAGKVMPLWTENLSVTQNSLFEAVMVACTCEARRVYAVQKWREEDEEQDA